MVFESFSSVPFSFGLVQNTHQCCAEISFELLLAQVASGAHGMVEELETLRDLGQQKKWKGRGLSKSSRRERECPMKCVYGHILSCLYIDLGLRGGIQIS